LGQRVEAKPDPTPDASYVRQPRKFIALNVPLDVLSEITDRIVPVLLTEQPRDKI